MIDRRVFTQFDYLLFGAAILLALLGVVGIYSATSHGSGGLYLRQLLWVSLGIMVCLLVTTLDYRALTDRAFFLYGASIMVLVGILIFGTEINGSKSWLSIAGFGFQPSELVKLVVILAAARYLSGLNRNYLRRRHFIVLLILTLVPMLLVILQGDLGTALMYVPVVLGMALVAGLRMRVLMGLLLCSLCLAPLGWYALKDYQKQRILVTLDPGLDPQGFGYQTRQAQIAIGSGGLSGKGLGNGLQSQLGFVPEIHTDFIFALLAEETGFLGAILILLLYLFVLTRLVSIAEKARDRTGILILTGIAGLLFVHVIVNVGMAVGVLPAIGIPLPLLSYGGSSTVSTFIALGLALSVYHRRFVYS